MASQPSAGNEEWGKKLAIGGAVVTACAGAYLAYRYFTKKSSSRYPLFSNFLNDDGSVLSVLRFSDPYPCLCCRVLVVPLPRRLKSIPPPTRWMTLLLRPRKRPRKRRRSLRPRKRTRAVVSCCCCVASWSHRDGTSVFPCMSGSSRSAHLSSFDLVYLLTDSISKETLIAIFKKLISEAQATIVHLGIVHFYAWSSVFYT